MTNLLPYLLQRTFASRALDVVKMKSFVPCEVEDQSNDYKARIVEIVYDPLRVDQVNDRFIAAGYNIAKGMQVIAVNEDDSILIWGGLNSVFHLKKGEQIEDAFDEEHLAFSDILDLTERFNIRNKKTEVDDLIAKLKSQTANQPKKKHQLPR